MSETAVCKRCGAFKPQSEFNVGKWGVRETWCRECVEEFHATALPVMGVGGESPGAGRNTVTSSTAQTTAERLVANPKIATLIVKMYARKEALRVRGSPKHYKCARCNKTAVAWHHISYEEEWWTQVVPVCAMHHKMEHSGALKNPLSEKDVPKWR